MLYFPRTVPWQLTKFSQPLARRIVVFNSIVRELERKNEVKLRKYGLCVDKGIKKMKKN